MKKETANFEVSVTREQTKKDGKVKAEVSVKPLGTDQNPYSEIITLSTRSISGYANSIQEMFELEDSERNDLKTDIMRMKNDIKENAEEKQREEEQPDQLEEKYIEILQHLISAPNGQMNVEDIDVDFNVQDVVDEADPVNEKTFMVSGELQITDKGREKVREYLGLKKFDGDPEAEAQRQLDDNPLRYYLDSFNKIHKGDHLLKIWELISALSSTCADRQIHSWAVGPSGKGKSHLKRKLLKFLPPEAYTQKESFSPKALQYKSKDEDGDTGFLDNQLVFFDEVGENIENAIELIRLLTDQDKDVITHETVKDQEVITLTLRAGNVTVWFTSVDTIQDEQLKNRFILTNPDASSAQDDTVNAHQQNILNRGGDLDFMPKEAPIIQRMVRQVREKPPEYKPVVPFKINWKQKFNRRLYPFFYTLMGMIAKIHYKNRLTRNQKIIVTEADFNLAKLIWGKLIDTTVAQTDEESIKLLKQLPESREEAIDRQRLRLQLNGFSTNKVKETCEKLEETEELQLINTDYEEGRYVHWAGADVEKLVDNKPEIKDKSKDVIRQMLQESGVEPDEEIMESIYETEIPVYTHLKKKLDEKEEEEEEELDVEITEEEKQALKHMKEFVWDATLDTLQTMLNDEEDLNIADVATSLEEKGVIRIQEDNTQKPTAKLDQLKNQGEVRL